MEYTFEKMGDGDLYQVRLHGQFVTYIKKPNPFLVDKILVENGWASREEFYEESIKHSLASLEKDLKN